MPAPRDGQRKVKVIVVGGGVGGLTAAHELVERGFEVHVYERKTILGGKSRAPIREVKGTGKYSKESAKLPTEHGFRFFPGFYRHVIDTMKRIPTEDGPVSDHLVNVRELRFLGEAARSPMGGTLPLAPVWYPSAFLQWVAFLPSLLELAPVGDARLTADDIGFFASKIWRFLTTCHERRVAELEGEAWFAFLDSPSRSPAYQKYLGIGLTRNLVACKADKASTLTVGTIGLQFILDVLYGIFLPRRVDRVLDGPTSAVWIEPWEKQLTAKGVVFHKNHELKKINVDPARHKVTSLIFQETQRPERKQVAERAEKICADPSMTSQAETLARQDLAKPDEEAADHYVFALPIEQMSTFVTKQVRAAAPAWAVLPDLAKSVDWMNGVMFYLTRRSEVPTAHIDFLDSDWALTSIFQDEALWRRWAQYAGEAPEIKQILSVDVSDWNAPTARPPQKAAVQLTRDQIDDEVWEQVKAALAGRHGYAIDDAHLKYSFVDDDITDVRKSVTFGRTMAAKGRPHQPLLANAEPLLVNQAGTRRLRPEASGDLTNAYLASDYVRTTTDLATMEGANEAARRAVNAILRCEKQPRPCTLYPLREPLGVLRAIDRAFFERGRPWPAVLGVGGQVMRTGMLGLVKVTQAVNALVGLVRGAVNAPPVSGTTIAPAVQAAAVVERKAS